MDEKLSKRDIADGIIDLNNAYYAYCKLLADSVYVKSMDDGIIIDRDRVGMAIIRNLIDDYGNALIEKVETSVLED